MASVYTPREIVMRVYILNNLHDVLCQHPGQEIWNSETADVEEEARSGMILFGLQCKRFSE